MFGRPSGYAPAWPPFPSRLRWGRESAVTRVDEEHPLPPFDERRPTDAVSRDGARFPAIEPEIRNVVQQFMRQNGHEISERQTPAQIDVPEPGPALNRSAARRNLVLELCLVQNMDSDFRNLQRAETAEDAAEVVDGGDRLADGRLGAPGLVRIPDLKQIRQTHGQIRRSDFHSLGWRTVENANPVSPLLYWHLIHLNSLSRLKRTARI